MKRIPFIVAFTCFIAAFVNYFVGNVDGAIFFALICLINLELYKL